MLLDPPYGFDDWPALLAAVAAVVADDGVVVIESDHEIDFRRRDGLVVTRSRSYGSTVVTVRPPIRSRSVTRVLYPGSFDPVHNGHIELIEVAASLFDEVDRGRHAQPAEGQGLFDLDERQAMHHRVRRAPAQRRAIT